MPSTHLPCEGPSAPQHPANGETEPATAGAAAAAHEPRLADTPADLGAPRRIVRARRLHRASVVDIRAQPGSPGHVLTLTSRGRGALRRVVRTLGHDMRRPLTTDAPGHRGAPRRGEGSAPFRVGPRGRDLLTDRPRVPVRLFFSPRAVFVLFYRVWSSGGGARLRRPAPGRAEGGGRRPVDLEVAALLPDRQGRLPRTWQCPVGGQAPGCRPG